MSADSTVPLSERPTNIRWLVFVLGSGTSWILYLHRYTFALIKPKLAEEWNLDSAEMGILDSTFSACYSLFQIPIGVLADVAGAHLVLGGIILLWSISLGMHAWAPSFGVLQFVRGAFGATQAGAFASLNRVTRSWFPDSIRTSVQGWMGVFFGRFGGLSANLLFGFFMIGVLGLDWHIAIYILGGIGVAHGLAFLLLFRNSPREHPLVNRAEVELIEEVETPVSDHQVEKPKATNDGEEPQRMPIMEMLRRLSPRSVLNLLALNLQSTLSTIADNIYSNWIPLFLFQVYSLKFKEMGIYSALPLLGGAIGGAIGGFLNDYLIRVTGNRRWSRTAVGLTGKGGAGILLFCALHFAYDDPYVFCIYLFFVKLVGDWSLSTGWGTVTDIGGKATASVFAFNNSVAGIGAIVAPIVYGFVARDGDWRPVFLIAAVAYLLCAASWLLINCTIPLMREDADGGAGPTTTDESH